MLAEQPDNPQNQSTDSPQPGSPRNGSEALSATIDITPERAEAFVQQWVDEYLDGRAADEDLWDWYREEFSGWSLETFVSLNTNLRRDFRAGLRLNGVCVAGRGSNSEQLFRTLNEEEQATWTPEEKERVQSTALNKRVQWNSRWRDDNVAALAELYRDGAERLARARSRTPVPEHRNDQLVDDTTSRTLTRLSLNPRDGREQSTTANQRFPIATPRNPTRDAVSTTSVPPAFMYDSGRAITTLMKIYDEKSKYHGSADILDVKVMVFYDLCSKAGVRDTDWGSAFSAMLAGDAKEFYYESLMNRRLDFGTLLVLLRENFETQERQTKFMSHWNMTSLQEVRSRHVDKTLLECFDIMYKELRKCQLTMAKEQQTDVFLKNRLLMACEGIEECRLAIFKPAAGLQGLRDDIRHALALSTPPRSSAFTATTALRRTPVDVTDTLLVDRRYYDNSKKHAGLPGKKCLVCDKPGCWSSNHPQEEQKVAFDKLARSKGLPQRMRQFIVEYEGTPSESTTAYENLIDSLPNEDWTPDNMKSDSMYASFGISDAAEVFLQLAEQTVFHAVSRSFRNSRDGLRQPSTAQILLETVSAKTITPPSTDPPTSKVIEMATFLTRYSEDRFAGILIDTGAAERSTVGIRQFRAIQSVQKVELDTGRAGEAKVTFGIGQSVSLGTASVQTPLGTVDFHVVPADIPFLLSLADLDRLRAAYNNLKDVVFQEGGVQVPVFRMRGHPWILLDNVKTLVAQDSDLFPTIECHLTEVELRQLHRRFGHPSVSRLENILRRAGQDWKSPELHKIVQFCHQCQIHGRSPGRFKFTLKDDKDFNHSVYTDVYWIDGKPVLHTVDESTGFQAAYFLKSMSAGHAWEALRASWIDVYLGPPALITHDPGTNFSSDEFRGNAHSVGSEVKETPTEAHNSVGKVERYHVPLKRAFDIVTKEMPEVDKEGRLQMAVKAVNDTAGPNGLIPTLLVFGAFPRMSREDRPTASNTQRAATIRRAMVEVRRCHAARQITDALRMRNGPDITSMLSLPLDSDVLVWRENEPYWSGPYKLVAIDGYTCKVQVNNKVVDFRVTSVKPYKRDEKGELPEVTDLADSSPPFKTPPSDPYRRPSTRAQADLADSPLLPLQPPFVTPGLGNTDPQIFVEPVLGRRNQRLAVEIPMPRINRDEYAIHPVESMIQEATTSSTETFVTSVFLTEKEKRDRHLAVELRGQGVITTPGLPFQESRRKEISSLLGKGVFQLIQIDDVPKGAKIFNSRLVDEVKGKETASPYEKSRLVIQAYNDKGKTSILTQSPTIQRMSQRALLALAPSLVKQGMFVRLRDITQAYPQSTSKLNRLIYAHPPRDIVDELPPGTVFWVVIPLYGIPEAGAHWYGTYEKHHRHKLGMEQSTYDPCLMVTKNPQGPFGIVGLQTDDTLFVGDRQFVDLEDSELSTAGLLAKPAQTLTPESPLAFNGCKLLMDADGSISAIPKDQGKRIDLVDPKSTTAKQSYLEQRARGAYIATICQPEALFDLSVAAQHQNPGPEEIKALNKRLQWQMDNQERGLRFIALPLPRVKLYVFVDGSFANNQDLSSQIGYIVTIGTEEGQAGSFIWRGNVIGYSSTKCKRVTRAVLASELYSMVAGVDSAIALSTTFALICKQLSIDNFPVVVCTDSFSLYECLVKLGTTKEKRLMIDIMALRQSYERRELAEIRWIEGDSNPADAMTKSTPNKALEQVVSTNRLEIRVQGYVQRPDGAMDKEE